MPAEKREVISQLLNPAHLLTFSVTLEGKEEYLRTSEFPCEGTQKTQIIYLSLGTESLSV